MAASRLFLIGLVCFAATSCSYGADPDKRTDFVLFFPGQSTALDPAANALIAQAAAAARNAPDLDVTVAGYADYSLTPEANQIQSRIRAQIVADALVRLGVARSRIELKPRRAIGSDPGVESRRLEIRIGS